jgi:hypothetical protein
MKILVGIDDSRHSNARYALLIVVALTTFSCSSMPSPVPLAGSSAGISALTGTWSGEYSSAATGRQGTIHFTLAADRDTASGQVLMFPRNSEQQATRHGDAVVTNPRPQPSALSISFVHAESDSVHGVLDPYPDPECGCTLQTWFMGRVRGDKIEGRYTSLDTKSGERSFGDWSVRRQAGKTAQPAAKN